MRGKNRKNMFSVMSHEGFGDCFITVHETTYIIPTKLARNTKKLKEIMQAIRRNDVDFLRNKKVNFVTKCK